MRRGTDADRKRLRIPPAYKDLKVATDPSAKLQATAKTPKGKTAYFYHPDFVSKQQEKKWIRVRLLVERVGLLAARVQADAAAGKTEALTVQLIMQTGMRNGNPGQGEKESFGASSLLIRHVCLRQHVDDSGATKHTLVFDFPGKKGVPQHFEIEDDVLLRHLERTIAAASPRIGEARIRTDIPIFPHSAHATLVYLKKLDSRLKVHDLRTWYATLLANAFVALFKDEVPEHKLQGVVCKAVAEKLGNTPAVVKKSYMDPLLFERKSNETPSS